MVRIKLNHFQKKLRSNWDKKNSKNQFDPSYKKIRTKKVIYPINYYLKNYTAYIISSLSSKYSFSLSSQFEEGP